MISVVYVKRRKWLKWPPIYFQCISNSKITSFGVILGLIVMQMNWDFHLPFSCLSFHLIFVVYIIYRNERQLSYMIYSLSHMINDRMMINMFLKYRRKESVCFLDLKLNFFPSTNERHIFMDTKHGIHVKVCDNTVIWHTIT